MPKRKLPPALKHAAYSSLGLLPGENAAAFRKLHKDLISQYAPVGPLEDDKVATIARTLWRKQNPQPFRVREYAVGRLAAIRREKGATPHEITFPNYWGDDIRDLVDDPRDPEELQAAYRAAEEQARKELGSAYKLIELGEIATIDGMMKELDVLDRFDAKIAKCVKELWYMQGFRSTSIGSSTASPGRIPGDTPLLDPPAKKNGGTP
jgi:hypothetical protein